MVYIKFMNFSIWFSGAKWLSFLYFKQFLAILSQVKLFFRVPNTHVLALFFLCCLENCQMSIHLWYVLFFFGAIYWSKFWRRDCILFTSSWKSLKVLWMSCDSSLIVFGGVMHCTDLFFSAAHEWFWLQNVW